MNAAEWEALRLQYPGKRRFYTNDIGQVYEWPWKSPIIPHRARLWTVESMDRWVKLSGQDLAFILEREEHEKLKKQKPKGNKKGDVDPRTL
jgi:hypothetical protein